MIIDCKNQEQIKELNFNVDDEDGRILVSVGDNYDGVTFRNFPPITADGCDFSNCVFDENK